MTAKARLGILISMSFCTAINCMDGRVQYPVNDFLKRHFNAEYVDVISEPGPNRILADGKDQETLSSIERRLRISIDRHKSKGVAVVGHYDCAGNPTGQEEQASQTATAIERLKQMFPDTRIIGLWVNEDGQVSLLD